MPKLIDHAQREIEVAEAAWRVAARDGVRAVSVRNVAGEAGVATASLRRAFPTQTALLAFCLDLVRRRAEARIARLPAVTDLDSACAVLVELLPLDDERRLEAEVQFSLGTAAFADPALRPGADAAHHDVARACRYVTQAIVQVKAATDPPPGDTPGLEQSVAELHALLDGLALHLVRQDPREPDGWALDILRRHLTGLGS